ncbi:MAG: hypothetical protein IT456_03470 [Planctomycetes bacterium]|nr:hypothetical protein [Planctomycetota bacterium]
MQLESHATPPPADTPQQRRAALHRAIQRGLDSDEVWRDLAEVCLELGFDDEASRCVRRIHNPTARLALESKLSRKGRLGTGVQRSASPGGHSGPPGHSGHSTAPAASNAGPQGNAAAEPARTRPDRFEIAGLSEHLTDAVQFLFVQHMPWLVLLTTLAFPLVVGLGGFLTAGNCPLSLAALAALPGLCVLAVVGATGRRILVDSSRGGTEVPAVDSLGPLLRDARHFLVDAALVLGSLLGPSVVALALGAPLTTTLPGLFIGLFFTPLAWGLRQVRRDLGALSPVTLLRGVKRCGLGYVGLAVLCVGMFTPAGLVTWAVFGRPVWVQIAVIGPLCVVPLFVASRLLGTWLDSMRLELGAVLIGNQDHQPRNARAFVDKSVAAGTSPTQPRQLRRPDALAHFEAPKTTAKPVRGGSAAPTAKSSARPAPARTPATAGKPTKPAARKAGTARAASQPAPVPSPARSPVPPPAPAPARAAAKAARPTTAASKRPAPPAAPAPQTAPSPEPRAIEGRSPRRPAMADTPDLSTMPGAVVVSGQERVKQGAAARPR